MDSFVYTGLPARVVFGAGETARLPREVAALGITRVLVLSTASRAAEAQGLADLLGTASAGVFSEAVMHTPVEVTDRAMHVFAETGADGVVSFGGGSTIGLGKAIALRNDALQIVVPTSYAGSEMTPIIGQTEGGRKTTQRTLKVLPETVIYDVNHTLSLPPTMSVASGLNAIAHAVEALYCSGNNPVLSLMAGEGIARMTAALPRLPAEPRDSNARSDAFYGALLCAVCLGSGGVALHHKLCHVLGGTFGLPHAETHAIVLPHALAYNAPAIPEAMAALRDATGSPHPAAALFDLARHGGVSTALKDLGMPRDGIARAVSISLDQPYDNPRSLDQPGLTALLDNAWHGRRPTA